MVVGHPKIYVAGPYSDNNVVNVLKNIGRGQDYAARLFMAGFAPFVPWFDKDFVIRNWDSVFSVDMFYQYSMEWLKVSDAVFVVPNVDGLKRWQDSTGTEKEIQEAYKLGILVFHDMQMMKDYFNNKKGMI